MASRRNRHCANCIGTLSFFIVGCKIESRRRLRLGVTESSSDSNNDVAATTARRQSAEGAIVADGASRERWFRGSVTNRYFRGKV